jgi:hypothetical protein
MAERTTAERITLVTRDANGKASTRILYRRARRKRKGTPGLRSLDDFVRRVARAEVAMEQGYLSRHDRSNRERADGWLLDLETNLVNAARRGLREFDRGRDLDDDDDDDDDNDDNDDNDRIEV